MQLNFVDHQQLADLLEQSTILDMIDVGNQRIYVLTFDSQDILAICSGDGATVIYPDSSFDKESGGSVHDHAREGGSIHNLTFSGSDD